MHAVLILLLTLTLGISTASAPGSHRIIDDGTLDPKVSLAPWAYAPHPAVDMLWVDVESNATHLTFTIRVADTDFRPVAPSDRGFMVRFVGEFHEDVMLLAHEDQAGRWNGVVWCHDGGATTCLESIPVPEENDAADTIRISVTRAMSGSHVINPYALSSVSYGDEISAIFGDIAPDTGRGANYFAP